MTKKKEKERKARDKALFLRLYSEEYDALVELARLLDTTMADILRDALSEYLPKLGVRKEILKTFRQFYDEININHIIVKLVSLSTRLDELKKHIEKSGLDATYKHEILTIGEELRRLRETLSKVLESLLYISQKLEELRRGKNEEKVLKEIAETISRIKEETK